MSPLPDDHYLAALTAQSTRFAHALQGTDVQQRVPTCPEWTIYQLAEHLGQAHRRTTALVTQRATSPVAARELQLTPPPEDPERLGDWVCAGAAELVQAIQVTGLQTPMWSWTEDQRARFWARRMTHETAVHRADLELAQGHHFTLEPELAADAISEWLGLVCSAKAVRWRPELAELCGDGQLLHLHSTDAGLGEAGEWIIRRTPSGPVWEHGHSKGDVAVRGAVVDLLLVLLGRTPPDRSPVQVLGDSVVLDHWLQRTRF